MYRVLVTSICAAALALLLLPGCETCETEADCLITCDCDSDGAIDSMYPHDCNAGVCGQGYSGDLEAGCEGLCSDPFVPPGDDDDSAGDKP